MKKLVIFLSDIHCGSKVALLNPDTVLYEEGPNGEMREYKPELTESQKYLWDIQQWYLMKLQQLVKKNKYEKIILVLNGDITHGNKHKSLLVSDRISDQILISKQCIDPILDIGVTHLRIVKGTDAHNFGFGAAEFLLCEIFKNERPDIDTEVLTHGSMSIDGFIIDYAHHSPGAGARMWLRGNVIRNYVRDIMINARMCDRKVPNLVIRSHIHSYCRESVRVGSQECIAITTPSMSLMDDFAVQVTQSKSVIENGLLAFEIKDGKMGEVYEMIQTKNVMFYEEL